MSFDRPTLPELIDQAEAEVSTRLGIGPLLRRGVLRVLARVMAGLAHSTHGHLDYISRQILPDTSSVEFLDRHAELRGLTRKPAAFAGGAVTFTGAEGSVIPAGKRLQRADGRTFVVTEDIPVTSDTGDGRIEDTSPGVQGDCAPGTELTLVSPVAGVDPIAVSGEISGGADVETDAQLRSRVLMAWRQRPALGTEDDYERWALEVPGITRAFARGRFPTLGHVTVYVLADDSATGPEPTTDQLAEVQNALDVQRPIVASVTAAAPVVVPVDFTVQLEPRSEATRLDAIAGIDALLKDEIRPGSTLRLSRISEVISAAAGELHHRISEPATDVVVGLDEVLVLGVVTWS